VEINTVLINWEEKPATLNFINDITDRKRAENALRESEARNRAILNAIPDLMFQLDKHGTFVDYNVAKANDLAVPAGEFLGKKVFEVLPVKLARQIMHNLKRALQTSKMQSFEYQLPIPLPNGDNRDFEARLVANKEDEVFTIVRDITEQKRAQEKIKTSLKEKEVLLKEIHHRVKNSLQVISSLLYLQSKYLKDQESLNIFLESQNRIRSMALVHEKLYRAKNLAQINLSAYINDLANSLFRSYSIGTNKVKLVIDIQKTVLDIDTAIPCGLILNELISNALKYAFPKDLTGEIRIALKLKQNGVVELLVSDNGVGLPTHFDINEKKSLGMRLVEALVEQVSGIMEIENNNGTAFKILFKKRNFKKDKKK